MRAVLVGLNGNNKLYYDIDADGYQLDGIVEMPNGDSAKVDFFSYVSASNNLKKLRTTVFHRRLWDEPQKGHEKAWEEMFVDKLRKPTDKMITDIEIVTTIGRNRSKLKAKSESVETFMKKKKTADIQTKSCCNEQLGIVHMGNQVFSSNILRREAWQTMILLRDLGRE